MNKKYLRKEDIKSGMLVEYCGELCLVVGSTSGLCISASLYDSWLVVRLAFGRVAESGLMQRS